MNAPFTPRSGLGRDLRALRTQRGLTLETVAGQLGRSVGWLSQVERGISHPGFDDLQAVAQLLGVPLSLFFGAADAPAREAGRIVRAEARRTIGERDAGLSESLLSPDLTDSFEMVHSTFAPRAERQEHVTRPTQEVAYMVDGRLDLWIGEEHFTVAEGDSFRIRGEAFRWANPYPKPAIAVWVISPPVY
ncbi:MAG: XRE family transcriptional regulator [Pseudomonadota bacterium]